MTNSKKDNSHFVSIHYWLWFVQMFEISKYPISASLPTITQIWLHSQRKRTLTDCKIFTGHGQTKLISLQTETQPYRLSPICKHNWNFPQLNISQLNCIQTNTNPLILSVECIEWNPNWDICWKYEKEGLRFELIPVGMVMFGWSWLFSCCCELRIKQHTMYVFMLL